MKKLAALAVMVGFFNSAHADVTGNMFLSMAAGTAEMYVWAIVETEDIHLLSSMMAPKDGWFMARPIYACVPGGVTSAQTLALVNAFLKERPNEWHQPMAPMVRSALYRAWPCPS